MSSNNSKMASTTASATATTSNQASKVKVVAAVGKQEKGDSPEVTARKEKLQAFINTLRELTISHSISHWTNRSQGIKVEDEKIVNKLAELNDEHINVLVQLGGPNLNIVHDLSRIPTKTLGYLIDKCERDATVLNHHLYNDPKLRTKILCQPQEINEEFIDSCFPVQRSSPSTNGRSP